MNEYNIDEVRSCYNLAAKAYSETFSNELEAKPFDRSILERFAQHFTSASRVIEFACASAHIGKFLFDHGVRAIESTDISEESIQLAKTNYPGMKFSIQNMLSSSFTDDSIDGIICFYGIVHFTYDEITRALREWKRILKTGGRALFCFHAGNEDSMRINDFLGVKNAQATWNYFDSEKVIAIMQREEIPYDEAVVRYPYLNGEYPSKRCYISFTKQ